MRKVLIALLVMILALQMVAGEMLIDYGNGNLGRGLGNHIQGMENVWRGNSNDVSGVLNSVRGNDNRIDGNNNVVMGSGNVVSNSLSKEEMDQLKDKMNSAFAQRFSNMFEGSPLAKNQNLGGTVAVQPQGRNTASSLDSLKNKITNTKSTLQQVKEVKTNDRKSSIPTKYIEHSPQVVPSISNRPQIHSAYYLPQSRIQSVQSQSSRYSSWYTPTWSQPTRIQSHCYNSYDNYQAPPPRQVIRPHFAPHSFDLLAQLCRSRSDYYSYDPSRHQYPRQDDSYSIHSQQRDWLNGQGRNGDHHHSPYYYPFPYA